MYTWYIIYLIYTESFKSLLFTSALKIIFPFHISLANKETNLRMCKVEVHVTLGRSTWDGIWVFFPSICFLLLLFSWFSFGDTQIPPLPSPFFLFSPPPFLLAFLHSRVLSLLGLLPVIKWGVLYQVNLTFCYLSEWWQGLCFV